jgi:hypothetical protein
MTGKDENELAFPQKQTRPIRYSTSDAADRFFQAKEGVKHH